MARLRRRRLGQLLDELLQRASGWAPTKPSTGRPWKKADLDRLDAHCAASSWFSSTLILTSLTRQRVPHHLSMIGPSCLHGPHHGAQKSTITGTLHRGIQHVGAERSVWVPSGSPAAGPAMLLLPGLPPPIN
jgi:hypothetical protein